MLCYLNYCLKVKAVTVSVFLDLVLRDLDRLKVQKGRLDMEFQKGLGTLKVRNDIVVRSAQIRGGGCYCDLRS